MNSIRKRLVASIELRDAALALLEKRGEPDRDREGACWFERHTPTNPEPRLSLFLSNDRQNGSHALNVWGTLKGKHTKVLNVLWNDRQVEVVTFRRGGWESELLAMGRAASVPVH